jgi:hypothetical protein
MKDRGARILRVIYFFQLRQDPGLAGPEPEEDGY